MPATEALSLDDVSVLLVWTAIAIYALAFIAYAVDLARRSEQAVKAQDTRARTLVSAAATAGATGSAAGGGSPDPAASATDVEARPSERPRHLWARIATAMMWLGFLFHVAADVLRGIAAERVPWANMYEFALTGTMLMVAVYLGVLFRYDLRFLGAFVSGLVVVLLGGATLAYYVEVQPLMDPLKSVWLVIHVFVASLSTAFFALAFALSVLQLFQVHREAKLRRLAETDSASLAAPGAGSRLLRTLPNADTLESLAYRFAIIGFIFWTFTLIAGSIWANEAWGRYWGFDTKEVWTFVIWVLYAGYIHARATRGWRGVRSAWLSIIGFVTVIFNFTIVNQFFKGLHAYSGLN
ncbi:c-type cytochrome biogenesis protein CcsB [Microbacterium sp. zg.Y1090]|uniref:c-type cytochrome biogenesis protein CcsB n=1 Tax=Microbacterium TaxID=33882 RepID=UPI00214C9952|nr:MULTISPECIES: c-type cytochrome biogenesis protein CcsB [unclassified Microbacterium]MCR2812538.1 c-type cytochrome biogenesis protein CcsB [Microbacterium sp. zg.Y1084]MCR2817661.1 c-type cytochrome biogenesis protein CcsB [Microbacterium sp. zg.Y1090]MDL5485696.1 c-type cytochrome biogenesis protein CcsB [Microbacterium sp. zg-Y1211]WIM28865.1 c-type cytochrome biogenesis protein CcsB [Microbacterium sp. zg-Y1090]